jgi:hypothetical protein
LFFRPIKKGRSAIRALLFGRDERRNASPHLEQ